MTRPIHKIYQNDGTFIERPFTDEEMVVWEKDQADEIARQEAITQAAAAKNALLQRLGITEEEAKLLLS